jgi:tetratricopeptide (TPR) repeat protein
MFLFALLAGAALGMRMPAAATARSHPRAAAVTVVFAGIVLLPAAGRVWVPIVAAEALAQEADETVRSSKPPDAPPEMRPDRGKVDSARDSLVKAFQLVPFNGDYAFRAEQAALLDGNANAGALRSLLGEAISADPRRIRYLNARAGLEAMSGDPQQAATDYEQILQLDPHNLELRLQYAAVLERLGRRDQAIANYQKVLEFNAQLAPDEIRRLSPKQVEEIRAKVGSQGANRSK